jgi:hypothetical protein
MPPGKDVLSPSGFTGRSGGEMALRCDLCLRAPSDSTPLIHQIHRTAAHIICGLVEKRLFPAAYLIENKRSSASRKIRMGWRASGHTSFNARI